MRTLVCMPIDRCVMVDRIEKCVECSQDVGVAETSPKADNYTCFDCFMSMPGNVKIEPPTQAQIDAVRKYLDKV